MKQIFSKMPNLVKAITVLMFLFSVNVASAQSNGAWTLKSENKGVKLYYKVEVCNGKNTLVLKVENTNSDAKHVSYNIVIESPGHNMPLLPQSVELAAGETKSGSCTSKDLSVDIKNITNPSLVVVLTVN